MRRCWDALALFADQCTLPAQLEAYVQYKIDAGLYSNGAEVIRDALRRMMGHDDEVAYALRLRDALQLGVEQIERGEGLVYTLQRWGEEQQDRYAGALDRE